MSSMVWAASTGVDAPWAEPVPGAHGRVVWVPREDGRRLAGVWEVEPDRIPARTRVVVPHRETVYVIEGEVEVEVEGDRTLVLRSGDLACFEAGAVTYWTVRAHLREFFAFFPEAPEAASER